MIQEKGARTARPQVSARLNKGMRIRLSALLLAFFIECSGKILTILFLAVTP
jgi:hypothetical protein